MSGIDAASLVAVRGFFDRIVDRTVPVSGTRVAELTKLLENTFRHVNIALVNELAMFAGDLGIDVWESIEAASTKPFGYMRFTPGPGVGGHCLPIDPSYLSWKVRRSLGVPFRFVELANDVNAHMPDYVVRRLVHALNRMGKPANGSRILLLGLAYKRNTADARTSPGLSIAEGLVELGASAWWPIPTCGAEHIDVPLVVATAEELAAADAVVLVTDHDAFDYASVVDNAPVRARHPQPDDGSQRRAALSRAIERASTPWPRRDHRRSRVHRCQPVCRPGLSAGGRSDRGRRRLLHRAGRQPGRSGRRRDRHGVDPRHRSARGRHPRARGGRPPRGEGVGTPLLEDPVATHEANATGTLRVLEAARHAGGPHVIVASSSSVYGANRPSRPARTWYPAPLSPYAASKLAAEAYALAHAPSFGVPVLVFRFFNVFGPLQRADHAYAAVVPAFVSAALEGRALPIHGDGLQTRDFTFVGSVTAVLAEALSGEITAPGPVNLAFGGRELAPRPRRHPRDRARPSGGPDPRPHPGR